MKIKSIAFIFFFLLVRSCYSQIIYKLSEEVNNVVDSILKVDTSKKYVAFISFENKSTEIDLRMYSTKDADTLYKVLRAKSDRIILTSTNTKLPILFYSDFLLYQTDSLIPKASNKQINGRRKVSFDFNDDDDFIVRFKFNGEYLGIYRFQ